MSSQGNDSYVLFDRSPPHTYRGTFLVRMDGVLTGDTDGLEATALNLGGDYSHGLVMVQDGARAWLGRGNQNFKLIPWSSIEKALVVSD